MGRANNLHSHLVAVPAVVGGVLTGLHCCLAVPEDLVVAISLYTGLVGSGKTYEVIKYVILPAILAGRCVVTNIEGLSPDAVAGFLLSGKNAPDPDKLGRLVCVDRLAPGASDFFPVAEHGVYRASRFVPLGALVVVDECPLFWGPTGGLAAPHLAYFREHRHFVDENGVAADLVIIAQTVDAVHRQLRGLVEFSVDCRKLSALGLSSKYTTVTYEGSKRSGKYVLGRFTRTYDKAIFPLYKSFSVANAKIVKVDERFSMFRSKWLWLAFGIAPFVVIFGAYRTYNAFFGGALVRTAHASSASPRPTGPAAVLSHAASSRVAPATGRLLSNLAPPPRRSLWRVSGSVVVAGLPYAVLRRAGYPLRFMPLSQCVLSMGAPVSCRAGSVVFTPGGSHHVP